MMKRYGFLLLLLVLAPAAAFGQSFSAILNGAAEVPGPGDPDGNGMAVISLEGTTLRYTVWTQSIGVPTAAHIHLGAAGASGAAAVALDVNMLGNGTQTVEQTLADAIRANPGGYYLNVHTAEFPEGALRGQLIGEPQAGGGTVSWLPGLGKVAGQFGTNFVTDMRILNNGASTATVTLDFFPAGTGGNAGPGRSATVTVFPGEQKVLDDVIGETLNLGGGLGGLRISSDQNIEASARILNDLRASGEGTAGFAVNAVESAQSSSTILFLAHNADYRTNLGYFNPSPDPVTLTLAVRTASGALIGTRSFTVPGYAFYQDAWYRILNVGEAQHDDFFATWSATAPIFVYGSVTDNETGDAVLNQ